MSKDIYLKLYRKKNTSVAAIYMNIANWVQLIAISQQENLMKHSNIIT
jgi:hypothetical protein